MSVLFSPRATHVSYILGKEKDSHSASSQSIGKSFYEWAQSYSHEFFYLHLLSQIDKPIEIRDFSSRIHKSSIQKTVNKGFVFSFNPGENAMLFVFDSETQKAYCQFLGITTTSRSLQKDSYLNFFPMQQHEIDLWHIRRAPWNWLSQGRDLSSRTRWSAV